MECTQAMLVWERAGTGIARSQLRGDLELENVLLAHGLAMNGGVLHLVQGLGPELLAETIKSYRYFGYDDIADLLVEAIPKYDPAGPPVQYDWELDRRFYAYVVDDNALFKRFENHFNQNPTEYAAV